MSTRPFEVLGESDEGVDVFVAIFVACISSNRAALQLMSHEGKSRLEYSFVIGIAARIMCFSRNAMNTVILKYSSIFTKERGSVFASKRRIRILYVLFDVSRRKKTPSVLVRYGHRVKYHVFFAERSKHRHPQVLVRFHEGKRKCPASMRRIKTLYLLAALAVLIWNLSTEA